MMESEAGEQRKQGKLPLHDTAAEVVGLLTRKHGDWFDEAN